MITIIKDQNKIITKTIGTQGVSGPPGGSGTGGTGPGIQVIQNTPSITWVVNHNLGYKPQVQVFSIGGIEVDALVVHINDNQYQVQTDVPRTGYTIYQ